MPEVDETAGFVENAESGGETPAPDVEPGAAAPEGGDTPPEAPEAPKELAGDETEEQIAAHFPQRLGQVWTKEHAEQLTRLSKGGRETKANAARIAELEGQLEGRPAVGAGIRALADHYDQGVKGTPYAAKLEELGPEEFVKFMTDKEYGQPEAREGLDMDDPIHRQVAELQDRMAAFVSRNEEKEKAATQKAREDGHRERVVKAVAALNPAEGPETELLWRLTDVAAAMSLVDETDMDKVDYTGLAATAKELLTSFRGQAAGVTQPDSRPRAVPSTDTDPNVTDYGDETPEDREIKEFERRAGGR